MKSINHKKIVVASSIILLIVLIIVLLLQYYLKNKIEQRTYKDADFYQYFEGEKFNYTGTIIFDSENNIVKLKDNNIDLDSTPVYYNKEQKIILPDEMAVVYPLSNIAQYRINRFTTLEKNNNTINLTDGLFKKELQNCFIYDTQDLYLFLDETKIIVGESEYLISAFSYVKAYYHDYIEIYNYQEDRSQIIDAKKIDVFAQSDSFTINLSLDSINNNESERLLIKNTEYLKNLE